MSLTQFPKELIFSALLPAFKVSTITGNVHTSKLDIAKIRWWRVTHVLDGTKLIHDVCFPFSQPLVLYLPPKPVSAADPWSSTPRLGLTHRGQQCPHTSSLLTLKVDDMMYQAVMMWAPSAPSSCPTTGPTTPAPFLIIKPIVMEGRFAIASPNCLVMDHGLIPGYLHRL